MKVDLTKKQPIFIFGSPRSGTTLLQRLLNSYKDVLIWGEHAGFLYDLSSGFYKVWKQRKIWMEKVSWERKLTYEYKNRSLQAWMNSFDKEAWMQEHRHFLEGLFCPKGLIGRNFWGIKEVNYMTGPGDNVIRFLHQLFPTAIFIFVARNAFNVLASVKRKVPTISSSLVVKIICERWKCQNQSFLKWHQSRKIRSFWISYEDLIKGDGELVRLLKVMGKVFGEEQRTVLGAKLGRGTSFPSDSYDERWKTLPPAWLATAYKSLGRVNREMGFRNPFVFSRLFHKKEKFMKFNGKKTQTIFRSMRDISVNDTMDEKQVINFCPRLKKCMFERVDNKILLLNLSDGNYYKLNESALIVARGLKKGSPFRRIRDKIQHEFKIGKRQATRDALTAIQTFHRLDLLETNLAKNGH